MCGVICLWSSKCRANQGPGSGAMFPLNPPLRGPGCVSAPSCIFHATPLGIVEIMFIDIQPADWLLSHWCNKLYIPNFML